MIIDVHNHFYPPEFVAAIKKGPSRIVVEEDAHGNPVFVSPGDRNFLVPGHRDIDYREKVIADAGYFERIKFAVERPIKTSMEPTRFFASGQGQNVARLRASEA